MKHIQFLTPNARRQAGDWLRRHNVPCLEKLLSLETLRESVYSIKLNLHRNHYVLILPPPFESFEAETGIAWSVRTAGTYGISYSELSWIDGIPFLYQAGSQALLEELRTAIGAAKASGEFKDKLIFTPQISGDKHYYQVTKKRGVKLQ